MNPTQPNPTPKLDIPYQFRLTLTKQQQADLREAIEERAAIFEYCDGIPRAEAERLAVERESKRFL